jgi:hypothetical protein
MGQSLCIAINWHRWAEWGSLSLGLEISQLITVMCEAATHPHGGMELRGESANVWLMRANFYLSLHLIELDRSVVSY